MSRKRLLALVSALASQSVAAETIYYDCDTPGAKYSAVKLSQSGSNYRVRGTITPMELRSSERWRAAATVFVQSSETKDSAAVRFMNMSGKSLDVVVDVTEGGSKQRTNIGVAKLDGKVSFDIYLPATGEGFADVAGKRVLLRFPSGRTRWFP